MKKLTRKLIPAFAMLLLSAVLMSTASFAWFTMNTNVTATGIQVTATAPAALWISQSAGRDTMKTTIAFDNMNTDGQIEPVTIKWGDNNATLPEDVAGNNGTNNWSAWEFYLPASDEVYRTVDNKGSLGTIVFPGEGVTNANVKKDEAGNYFKDQFFLYLDGAVGEQKVVQIQASVTCDKATPDKVWQSLRIAMVTAGGVVVIEPTKINQNGAETIEYSALADLFTITAQAAATEVAVYVWFEGTDSENLNSNAQNAHNFVVDFKFACKGVETDAD